MKPNFGLPEKSIDKIEELLSAILSNHYVLYVKTLNCHWNLEDPRFIALHELFEAQYQDLAKNGDMIAERIRKMGRYVNAALKAFHEQASLKEIESKLSGDEMIKELAESHEHAIVKLRDAINQIDEEGDHGTVDMLIELLRGHEKAVWFLRSHL